MRFKIGVAFPLLCGIDDLIVVGLGDLSALAFHVSYCTGLSEALHKHATIVKPGAGNRVDDVFVAAVDKRIRGAAVGAAVDKMRMREGANGYLAFWRIKQFGRRRVSVSVVKRRLPLACVVGCA